MSPLRLSLVGVLLAGCDVSASAIDNIFSDGFDQPVVCGLNLDDKNSVSTDAINASLDRAQLEGKVVHLYSHRANASVDLSTLETVLAGAADRGLATVTYRELVDGVRPGAALALSFDDAFIDTWVGLLPLFADYDAHVTFFISRYGELDAAGLAGLRQLADAGHAVEYHSTSHRNAKEVVAERGAAGYVDLDITPGLVAMQAGGYQPRVFAYPFGARDEATDVALRGQFPLLRASHFSCPR
jgi:peptidoglycan/xylan/chitin deacetylase (PgdA/CDA1 family)